jgi:hypothetical protein
VRNSIAILTVRLLFLLAPVLLLSACVSAPAFSGYDMTLDSDNCRAASILRADAPNAQSHTASERQADFDRVYHACMVAKGY